MPVSLADNVQGGTGLFTGNRMRLPTHLTRPWWKKPSLGHGARVAFETDPFGSPSSDGSFPRARESRGQAPAGIHHLDIPGRAGSRACGHTTC